MASATFSKYLKNTSWLLVERIFSTIVSFAVGIWLARYLSVYDYGVFNYAASFVALFCVLATMGVDKLFAKFYINDKNIAQTLLGTTLFIRIFGSLLLIVASYVFINYFNAKDDRSIALVIVFALAYIFRASEVIRYLFESEVISKYSCVAEGISRLFAVILTAIFIFLKMELIWFCAVYLIEAALVSLFYVYIYKKYFRNLGRWKFSFSYAKTILNQSFPLILAGALYTIYIRIDQIMLGNMIGNDAVGVYAAALTISEGWLFVPGIIAASFYPAMLEARKNDMALYRLITQYLLTLMVLISLSAAIFITIFSDKIILWLFGAPYIGAANILTIHVWGGVFICMSSVIYQYFIAEGLQKLSFYRGLTGFVINIILNYFFIPLYGGVGAAIATVLSQFCAQYLFNFINKKTRAGFIMQTRAILLLDLLKAVRYYRKLRSK